MASVSLSEGCALSENHPLREAFSPLSELGESGGESACSARHQLAQRVVCLLYRSAKNHLLVLSAKMALSEPSRSKGR